MCVSVCLSVCLFILLGLIVCNLCGVAAFPIYAYVINSKSIFYDHQLNFNISDVQKMHPKYEPKRYSEIFRDFDNLDLSLISW